MFSNRLISKEEFLEEYSQTSSSSASKQVLEEQKLEKETAKADLAFKSIDRNNDGYVTKDEMIKMSDKFTKKTG